MMRIMKTGHDHLELIKDDEKEAEEGEVTLKHRVGF